MKTVYHPLNCRIKNTSGHSPCFIVGCRVEEKSRSRVLHIVNFGLMSDQCYIVTHWKYVYSSIRRAVWVDFWVWTFWGTWQNSQKRNVNELLSFASVDYESGYRFSIQFPSSYAVTVHICVKYRAFYLALTVIIHSHSRQLSLWNITMW